MPKWNENGALGRRTLANAKASLSRSGGCDAFFPGLAYFRFRSPPFLFRDYARDPVGIGARLHSALPVCVH